MWHPSLRSKSQMKFKLLRVIFSYLFSESVYDGLTSDSTVLFVYILEFRVRKSSSADYEQIINEAYKSAPFDNSNQKLEITKTKMKALRYIFLYFSIFEGVKSEVKSQCGGSRCSVQGNARPFANKGPVTHSRAYQPFVKILCYLDLALYHIKCLPGIRDFEIQSLINIR